MIQTDLSSFSYKKGSLIPWCKRCGTRHFYRDGKNKQGIQKYKCRDCGCRFVWTSDLPNRRFFSQIINCAIELYTDLRKAMSLRGVAETIEKIFDIKLTYETVRQWILASKKTISRREISVPTVWHADETYFKIKGKGHWLWIIYCANTKKVLSWHISYGRFFRDAKKLFKQALNITGIRPKKIITDGLFQYAAAIKKVMGWKWNVYKKNHIIASGIGKNAIIERLNREIKRRIKWFSTFQSTKGAKAFFGLWFYHFNQRNPTHNT